MAGQRCYTPSTLDEAAVIIGEHDPDLTVIAGGTDLMVALRQGAAKPAALLDITRLDEAHSIRSASGVLDIGAAETFTAIASSEHVRRAAPALAQAAATVGSEQIRNRGTIGGNIVTNSPAGDSLPPLMALDASCVVAGPSGLREVPIARFLVGYRKTDLAQGEILLRLRIPVAQPGTHQSFQKIGPRRAVACSKVSLASWARLDDGGRISEARLAAGSVAPTVVFLPRTIALLTGRRPDPGLAEEAARTAGSEIVPIDDVRSTALYRTHVLGRLVARFVSDLATGH